MNRFKRKSEDMLVTVSYRRSAHDWQSRLSASKGGFTIIEVLIVLAVAGVILLLVFEAIPALSRSSRNNQRRQDVSAILQTVSHYELNNSASLPTPAQLQTLLVQYAHLTYYVSSSVNINTSSSDQPANTNVDTVNIFDHERCSTSNYGSASTLGTDYTNIVALYALETGSAISAPQCQQL